MSESTEMTTTQPAEITSAPESALTAPGMPEDLGLSDLVVPRLKLLQRMSRTLSDKAQPGMFQENISNEAFANLRVTILSIDRKRSNLPQGAPRPICWSDDGINPSPRVEEPVYTCCATRGPRGGLNAECPAAKWRQGERAECSAYFDVTLIDEHGAPYKMAFRSTATKTARAAITKFKLSNTAPCSWSALLSAEKRTNDRGEFFVPVLTEWQQHVPFDKHFADQAQLCGAVAQPSADSDDIPF